MSYTTIAGIILIVFLYVVIVQVARSVELVHLIKEKGKGALRDTLANRVNAWLMVVFLVLGMIGVFWYHEKYGPRILHISGSIEGNTYDKLLLVTFVFTFAIFLITQTLLFLFAFRYRARNDGIGFYFTHSNKLEILWTLIPSAALCVMISFGLHYWLKITGDAPKNADVVEVTGKQYQWIFRYPGKDGVLGKRYYKNINEVDNQLGQIWEDPANHDDVVTEELHLVVNRPVELLVTSRDVVHDLGLPHFRQKVDAVPGLPTRMWFTPQYTTEEMRSKLNDPDFTYEVVCDQMCGSGHYGMRAVVVVETQEEYEKWLFSQQPYYQQTRLFKQQDTVARVAQARASAGHGLSSTKPATQKLKKKTREKGKV